MKGYKFVAARCLYVKLWLKKNKSSSGTLFITFKFPQTKNGLGNFKMLQKLVSGVLTKCKIDWTNYALADQGTDKLQ